MIPKENEKDLADIPDNVKRDLEIIPVSMADEVLEKALTRPLVPLELSEEDEDDASSAPVDGDADDDVLVTH